MRRFNLLVVDDDPDVTEFVASAVGSSGIRVEAARSGEEAHRRVLASPPDMILLDVVLPGIDGLETFRRIREISRDIPIVFITSHATMEITIQAMKEGAYNFLTKPLRESMLTSLVERIRAASASSRRKPAARASENRAIEIVGQSAEMVEVFKMVGHVAATDTTVLIMGESGTGKELVARAIHHYSNRTGPFVPVNCAAIPETLLESELFGHEKGAFTGAHRRQLGKFELARQGTILLDEISEMPLNLQTKLLRVLEERRIERVGASESVRMKARIIVTTNVSLEARVQSGLFRSDLYYRLAVFTIELPPLRRRLEDLHLLTEHFVSKLAPRVGREIRAIDPRFLGRLAQYHWPGNVRELRNVVERSLLSGSGSVLTVDELPPWTQEMVSNPSEHSLSALAWRGLSLQDLERMYIARVVEMAGWNQTLAARKLGIHRNTLRAKIAEYGLAQGLGEPSTDAPREVGGPTP